MSIQDTNESSSEIKFNSLYDTVSNIYSIKKPISRVLYITKLKQAEGKDDKSVREYTLSGVRDEVKKLLKSLDSPFNLMILYIGSIYALIAIENSNENLMTYLTKLNQEINNKNSLHLTVNIITFVEDCPTSVFPVWYKYEGSVYMQESQLYKDKPVIEKGWVLYENMFCNMGRNLKNIIKTESDFITNEDKIKKEEAPYAKYFPSMDEVKEFCGLNFISLEYFVKLYVDIIDVELDEDIVWPYQWPLNV